VPEIREAREQRLDKLLTQPFRYREGKGKNDD
ncbi:sterol desaturase family protein, partial [Vibrio sp. 811]|nr:sterol desaturase family protein [Vibrio sp. 811]